MKFSIKPEIRGVSFPPIVEIKRLAASDATAFGEEYIDLCQAVPDFPPAPELIEFLQGVLPEDATALYTSDEGRLEVREAVCRRYGRLYGAGLAPENVCLTMGASQAFWLAMVTLCAAGDEVIVPAPTYFDYDMALRMLGISCVYAPFDEESGGAPDPEAIARLITPKTRAILLVTPCNPTGMTASPEVIEELYGVAEASGVALVADETYADFIAGGSRPHRLFTRPDWGDHFVHVMSFGKSYALTGYRAGLLAASEEFMHHALKVQDTMAICQPTPTQLALSFALDHLDPWLAGNRRMMEARHDRFREEFLRGENPFTLISSGTFFAFVKHPFRGVSAWQVARDLVERAGVITLPGEIFGPGLSDYLRIAFGNVKEEVMPEAVRRLKRFAGQEPENQGAYR